MKTFLQGVIRLFNPWQPRQSCQLSVWEQVGQDLQNALDSYGETLTAQEALEVAELVRKKIEHGNGHGEGE